MKYLALIMSIINIVCFYKIENLRKSKIMKKEDKSVLNDFLSIFRSLLNFILFGIALFLLSFALKTSVNISVIKVYNIIVIIYLVLNLFNILYLVNKLKKIIK